MTVGRWLKPYISDAGLANIQKAIEKAELQTAGEIVPVVIRRSTPVGHLPMLIALAIFSGLLVVSFEILAMDFYEYQFFLLPGFALASLILALPLSKITSIQKLLTSPQDQKIAVIERAEIEFARKKMSETKARTGILLLVSMMERRAVVLGDKAIADRLSPETWDEVVHLMTSELKQKDLEKGMIKAIEKCGQILAQNFPPSRENPNELVDKLIIID